MKTQKGNNGGTLRKLESGESGNPAGRPKGSRNRSTLLKWALQLSPKQVLPKKTYDGLKGKYPDLDDMTIEEVMHLAQIVKSIDLRDTNAYKAVMDSAYGAPKQEIENTQRITIIDDL